VLTFSGRIKSHITTQRAHDDVSCLLCTGLWTTKQAIIYGRAAGQQLLILLIIIVLAVRTYSTAWQWRVHERNPAVEQSNDVCYRFCI